ncbi:MAG: DUF192 domain-containing protein [Candidatus Nanohaloarchaea archaeon]|nr:DUF192 domain-containing protein [Candidatus Nanohaloarchaea archaeon]
MKIENSRNERSLEDVSVKRGLMDRIAGLMLKDSGRALLDFSKEGNHGIWMPLMRFNLDLAFINAYGNIVDIQRDVPPIGLNPNTWKVYRPEEKCRYVLEVESGLIDQKEFEEGDMLKFKI